MWWLYIFSLLILAVVIVILYGRQRGGLWGSAHARIVQLSGSAAANAVPAGYCIAMAFFLRLFDVEFLGPFAGCSEGHSRFIRACYSLPFLSMARLYFSDPGVITKANHRQMQALFPYDKILFFPYRECETCLFTKPARSKHCSICNRCTALQDHHCLWTNNCVGLLNFRWFMLFLFVNFYVFVYGLILLTVPLIHSFKSAWRHPGSRHWFWALVNMGEPQRVGVCLWILCAAILPLICIFIAYHLRYVWAGVSTNEADKWEDLHALLPDHVLFIYRPGTSILLQKLADGSWHRTLTSEERSLVALNGATLVPANTVEDIPNIYDHGFADNLRLLLFPPVK